MLILKEECVGVQQAEEMRSFPRKENCVSQCLGLWGQKSKTYSGTTGSWLTQLGSRLHTWSMVRVSAEGERAVSSRA